MLNKFKRLVKENLLQHYMFFYRYIGKGMYVTLFGSMLVAVLDGVGLTMFLPLLKVADGERMGGETEEMGDMSIVIDTMTDLGVSLNILNILFLMVVFFSLKGVAKFGAGYYRVILNQRFANKLRLRIMRLLADYDYSAFTKGDSGRIQNTFSAEVQRLNSAFRNYFLMLQQGIMTLVYVILAYAANPKFAIIVALGGLLSNLAFGTIYKSTKTASREISNKMHNFQGFLIQSVTSFKFLKATGLIQDYKKRIDASIISIEREQRRVGLFSTVASALREPLVVLIVVIGILVQVMVFEESIGLIILSLLFFYRGLGSLVAMQNFYNSFLGSAGAIENMVEFIDELKRDTEHAGDIQKKVLDRKISLRNLSYSYDNERVLQGLTLDINKNETIGLVGESGSGKTTLVNIICGLLKVPSGMLLIDGTDSTRIDLRTFRRTIGYVTQEAQVFTDSIFNNITFWDERTPDNEAKAWKALKLAHADGFVHNLPDKLETEIGINGVNLSGGQRQRISIARELYRDVSILVMDEATSALDSQSEHMIQENIDSLSGSYTMIVIAHRLSTIRNADKIVYLQPGGDYRVGTFETLTNDSETFRRMVALQTV